MHSLGLRKTVSKGVKNVIRVVNTSINSLEVLINVVLKLNKTLIFSKVVLLHFKRLRNFFVAITYAKSVRTIYFTTLTYTFNSFMTMLALLMGKLKKSVSIYV
jgi:hypothetical protein